MSGLMMGREKAATNQSGEAGVDTTARTLGVWLILVHGLMLRVNSRPTRHTLHGSVKALQRNITVTVTVTVMVTVTLTWSCC